MEFAARPYFTAGVVLAAAGVIAATPVVSSALPRLHTPNIQLTAGDAASFLEDVLGQQLASNSALIEGFFSSNAQLTTDQQGAIGDIASFLAGSDGNLDAAQDTLVQFFDANNALGGAGQSFLLGLLGVRGTLDDAGAFAPFSPAELNASLLVDSNPTASIPFAGLESAIGHYIGAVAFSAAIDGSVSGDDIEGGAAGEAFDKLVSSVTHFNQDLVTAQDAFGTGLVDSEVALEQALYGTDSAYNGVINRAFNVFNMMFDAQQQSLNGLLGVTGYNPQDLTASLLTGTDAQVFNDGSVGGLMGTFSQNLAMWTNIGGLLTGADTGIAPDWDFAAAVSSDEFQTALTDLFTTLGGGPFGDVFSSGGAFSDLLSDLAAMFTSFPG